MMQHSQGRHRRHQDTSVDDDDVLSRMAARGRRDVQRSDGFASTPYSSHNDGYRAAPTYDLDVPSSHHRGGADWRTSEPARTSHDPYYADSYSHRGARDDAEPWSARTQNQYGASSSRTWEEPYDAGYGKPGYAEAGWSAHGSHAGYDRHTTHEWSAEESRPGYAESRGQAHDRDSYGVWSRDDRRDDRKDERRDVRRDDRRDSGWDSRHRQKDRPEVPTRQWGTAQPATRPTQEERSWEPAPGWQAGQSGRRENNQYQRNPNGRYNNNNYGNNNRAKNSKKKNKNFRNNKQQQVREEEPSGGPMNNWTKRETFGKDKRTQGKQRYNHSPSRSRSRSPAPSYTSRRSSRGPSRSRSASPRRKKRDSGARTFIPNSPPPPSPRKKREVRERRSSTRSVSPHSPDDHARRRGRSISSFSSRSRSRTPSQSPEPRSRAVHRLPVATSVDKIDLTNGKLPASRPLSTLVPIGSPSPPLTKLATTPVAHTSTRENVELSPASLMPPPSAVHSSITDEPALEPTSTMATAPVSSPNGTRPRIPSSGSNFKLGFKPIGQSTSAIKRFFPGEDDEDVLISMVNPSGPTEQPRILAEPSPMAIVQDETTVTAPTSSTTSPAPTLPPPSLEEQDGRRPTGVNGHSISLDAIAPMVTESMGRERGSSVPVIPPTPSLARHDKLYAFVSQVGEGTFGKVYKARNNVTGVHVALKRIRMETERDGFPVTAMREIKLLQSLSHENVIRLHEMMVSDGGVYMVFEYMDHDLTGVLSQTQFVFTDAHLKSLCQQMLHGLAYLHHKGVIHRDIKGSNILLNQRGQLKLADFGLARFYQKRRRTDYTNRVITLWYRPPELLFGATVYGPEVDMWSAGCIMLELFTKKPVFQGMDEINQLEVVFKLLGTPNAERWPGVADLPWYELVKPREMIPNHFRTLFQKWLSPAALDLAEQLLAFDPSKRVTAAQALEAPYFHQEQPPAEVPVRLSELKGEWHELETKRERERAKKRRKTEGET